MVASVGGPEGFRTLLAMNNTRPEVEEAAQQLLEGTLEAALAQRRAAAEAARTSLLAGWAGDFDDDDDEDGGGGGEGDME